MSLRMNLYGWRKATFDQILGSGNDAVHAAAAAKLAESFQNETSLSQAKGWLNTLITKGFPFRESREPPSIGTDGGLLEVKAETDIHAFVVYWLARTIARDDDLNLAAESSNWTHGGVDILTQDMRACGFSSSPQCSIQMFSWLASLANGSPFFGDDFRTEWSSYVSFRNDELAAMIPVLEAAGRFTRELPEGFPLEGTNVRTSLSNTSKDFVADLIKFFGQIQRAGQDAFIFWW